MRERERETGVPDFRVTCPSLHDWEACSLCSACGSRIRNGQHWCKAFAIRAFMQGQGVLVYFLQQLDSLGKPASYWGLANLNRVFAEGFP